MTRLHCDVSNIDVGHLLVACFGNDGVRLYHVRAPTTRDAKRLVTFRSVASSRRRYAPVVERSVNRQHFKQDVIGIYPLCNS